MNDGSNLVEFVLPKPAIQFHSMFTEQVMEFVVLFKYVAKLVAYLSQKEKKEDLFQSPRKPSKEYSKALVELKSYCRFITTDKNINTGLEINDIRKAVNGYLNPSASQRLRSSDLENHQVFMSPAAV